MIEIPQEERDCVFLAQPTNQPNKQTNLHVKMLEIIL